MVIEGIGKILLRIEEKVYINNWDFNDTEIVPAHYTDITSFLSVDEEAYQELYAAFRS